jgi:hypothetical protein
MRKSFQTPTANFPAVSQPVLYVPQHPATLSQIHVPVNPGPFLTGQPSFSPQPSPLQPSAYAQPLVPPNPLLQTIPTYAPTAVNY